MVFITLHTYYPHSLYSSPTSRFYFTSLRFYSIFASPFYYCFNILYGFLPPPPPPFFFFGLDYISFYCTLSDTFLPILVFLSLTLPFNCLSVQLVFSYPPITSLHLISAIFKIFFPHHNT